MRPEMRRHSAAVAGELLGAIAGVVVAIVVTLNLHIWTGLEQGYAASPAEVLDASVVLLVVDVALLVAMPVLGVIAARRLRRHG